MPKYQVLRPTAFEDMDNLLKSCIETREELKRIEDEIKEARRRFCGFKKDKEE